jgi:hypothetical protein
MSAGLIHCAQSGEPTLMQRFWPHPRHDFGHNSAMTFANESDEFDRTKSDRGGRPRKPQVWPVFGHSIECFQMDKGALFREIWDGHS